jgi:hypothetical protein
MLPDLNLGRVHTSASTGLRVIFQRTILYIAGCMALLAASPAHAQLQDPVQCTNPGWVPITINFENVLTWSGMAPTYVADGDNLRNGMVIGPDPADGNFESDPVCTGGGLTGIDCLRASAQDTDPTADNYQPYRQLGLTISVQDTNLGGSCVDQSVVGGVFGAATMLNSADTANGDVDLQSPNNMCSNTSGWTNGTGVSGSGDGEPSNCDENTVTAPSGDVATNLMIAQENGINVNAANCTFGPVDANGDFITTGDDTFENSTGDNGYCPDDCVGSTFVFNFADPAPVEAMLATFVDLEEGAVVIQLCREDNCSDPNDPVLEVIDADAMYGGALVCREDTNTTGVTQQGGRDVCVGKVTDNGFSGIDTRALFEKALESGGTFCDTNAGCSIGSSPLTASDATDVVELRLVYSGSGSINDITFCFNPTTTPIVLGSFSSEYWGGDVRFEWTTETEFRNAGFFIEALVEGRWQRVNERLIPSKVVDSVVPQSYEYVGSSNGTRFRVIDVSTQMKERKHGPFELGQSYGERSQLVALDVSNAKLDRARKRSEIKSRLLKRKAARLKQRMRQRVGKRRDGKTAFGRVADEEALMAAVSDHGIAPALASAFPVYDLLVDKTGIYRVGYQDLRDAGLNLAGVPVDQLALTNRGRMVPIRVYPSAGVFGPAGFIEFFGTAVDSLYTRTNIYQLHLDPAFAARIRPTFSRPPRNAAPKSYLERRHFDEDNQYAFFSTTGDPWYNRRLTAFEGSPVTHHFTFSIDESRSGPATIALHGYGITNFPANPDHRVTVSLNCDDPKRFVELSTETFDGLHDLRLELPIPKKSLKDGVNTLCIGQPADIPGVLFDSFDLDTYGVTYRRGFVYPVDGQMYFEARSRVFEIDSIGISDARDVVVYMLVGKDRDIPRHRSRVDLHNGNLRFRGSRNTRSYIVSTVDRLLKPVIELTPEAEDINSGQAELLIVAYDDFLDTLKPLVTHRESQGWTVKAVKVSDVFGNYSAGIFDAQALVDYIEFARRNLGTRAVLLAGWDSYDYLDNGGTGVGSAIPTLYVDTGNGATFTPSDAAMAGVNKHGAPRLAIGRLPAYSESELADMIDKIIEYENGSYAKTGVYAADNSEGDAPFTQIAQNLINSLPADWQGEKAFVDEVGAENAKEILRDRINSGVAWTTFVGHSGPNGWAPDGQMSPLFDTADVDALSNFGAPTAITQWGCWNTYHVSPEADTMAHRFMIGETGAAAVLGATTITTAIGDMTFAPLLQAEIVKPGMTIGEALYRAKRKLAKSNPELVDILLGTTLLADPAMIATP